MKSVCKIAGVFATAVSGASVFRGKWHGELVPVVKDADNADESFKHVGPPALWNPVGRPDGSANLCVDQHLVPELYVLGVPKGATTSLWMDTDRAGIKMPVHGLFMDKEFRFFLGQNLSEDIATMKPKWLANMPACSTQSREVVADFNPHNLASLSHAYNPGDRKMGPGLPAVLKGLYGDGNAQRLRFMVMLREPLSRMQSHWHMNKMSFPFVDFGAKTFNDSMGMLHRELRTRRKAGKNREWTWLWESMYGLHLPIWLENFEAKQFLIVPMKEYTQGNAQAICREFSARLSFEIECVGEHPELMQRTNTNVHEHVAIADELDESLIQAFQSEIFGDSNDKLVRALAEANAAGAYLANYEGTPGNVEATRAWLKQGW